MINHSFEKKFYGAYYTLCKNVVRGFSCAQRTHKVLKWDFHYDAISQSVRKFHHSIFLPLFKVLLIFKTVNNNNNYNNNYFRRYRANYAFLHVSIKKILNRFTTFLLLVNESIKEIVRKILNSSKLIKYY